MLAIISATRGTEHLLGGRTVLLLAPPGGGLHPPDLVWMSRDQQSQPADEHKEQRKEKRKTCTFSIVFNF